jgi:hypothetical protein
MQRLAATAAAALLAGCAGVTSGGPYLELTPELQAGARVDLITMSSEWLRSEDDFSDTFVDEVREELRLCATGPRRLNLRVHVQHLQRGDRTPEAMHDLSALAEFVDPASGLVVGRYPIVVSAGVPDALAAQFADRQMIVSEAFGRELCLQAFGRNPRGHPLTNATPD